MLLSLNNSRKLPRRLQSKLRTLISKSYLLRRGSTGIHEWLIETSLVRKRSNLLSRRSQNCKSLAKNKKLGLDHSNLSKIEVKTLSKVPLSTKS